VAQINQDRYETLAARVLGVKGPGVFGHAEDAVFAGLALDTNAPIEFWYPQRIHRYGIGRVLAPPCDPVWRRRAAQRDA